MIRQAFRDAAHFFLLVVEQVPAQRWDAPGLGEWTVRDLVGHVTRALTTIEHYSGESASRVELERPVDYLTITLAALGQPQAVAERGRQAGRELGEDPVLVVTETVHRVPGKLDQMPDTTILGLPVGGMRLIDYLPTRILELTIHSLDLAAAIGTQVTPPDAPMSVTLHLLADQAIQTRQGPVLALAGTGRRPLPEGFNLLGSSQTPDQIR
jgi:uncharacterized protein (TIGR03083 family)